VSFFDLSVYTQTALIWYSTE